MEISMANLMDLSPIERLRRFYHNENHPDNEVFREWDEKVWIRESGFFYTGQNGSLGSNLDNMRGLALSGRTDDWGLPLERVKNSPSTQVSIAKRRSQGVVLATLWDRLPKDLIMATGGFFDFGSEGPVCAVCARTCCEALTCNAVRENQPFNEFVNDAKAFFENKVSASE
jgi:hypothetical protein